MVDSNGYTHNEVAAILERIEGKFQYVLDVVAPLHTDMIEVKERLSKVEVKVQSLEDVIKIAIPGLTKRVQKLEACA